MRHYIASMSRLPLLLFLILFASSRGALAAAQAYGLRYVEAGAGWPASAPGDELVQAPVEAAEAAALAAQLELELARLELDLGPYAPAIAETLLELARAEEAAGDTAAALASLTRALHLIRVNDGLYSASQGPVVRALLNVLRREGDYEALDGRYEYFYRLYGVGRPPFDEARWSAVMEYLRWQREALLLRLDGSPTDRLLELIRSNDALLAALEEGEQSRDDWQRHRDAALSQLFNYYLVDEFIQPEGPDGVPLFARRRDRFGPRENLQDFDPQRERLENLQRSVSARGKSLIESALARVPADMGEERLQLELELADWFQWQGNYREAASRYEQIWTRLQAEGLTALADAWFSRPVPLPDNGVFWNADRAVERKLTVQLSVSESGRATVNTEAVPEPLRGAASRLRRLLQDTRFRPVVNAGEVKAAVPEARSFFLLDR